LRKTDTGPQAQGSSLKDPKDPGLEIKELLARPDEDPLNVRMPDTVGTAVVAVEPLAIVIVPDIEHLEAAIRVDYRIHSDKEPLTHGLVLVLLA
jgi:hypothetical protein